MGLFNEKIEIVDSDGGLNPIEATVDTGASFSILPASRLEALGITPNTSREFGLADGTHQTFDIGEARFKIQGMERTSPVVFGNEDVYLLGAVTLETFGLIADTTNHRLIPAPLLMVGLRLSD